MHDTAYRHGRLFFELYGDDFRRVAELGSQDVNGSLRDHCPLGVQYIGLDMMPAKGVDLVVSPAHPLPLADASIDAIVTSSAFEHDTQFWETFLELIRILRPGGLLYINAPSNGWFHRYALDCWRFYPDAGIALVRWAGTKGIAVELIESFIGMPEAERWADFVAVFRKGGGAPLRRLGSIAERSQVVNVQGPGASEHEVPQKFADEMPDMQIARCLQVELSARQTELDTRSDELHAMSERAHALSERLRALSDEVQELTAKLNATSGELAVTREVLEAKQARVWNLEADLSGARQEIAAIHATATWRVTQRLRRIGGLFDSK